MTIAANKVARGLLCVVFAAAAAAKAHELLTHGPAKSRWTALENSWARAGMIVMDLVVVASLLSPRWRLGCALAIVITSGGNLVYAAALLDGRLVRLCGCLGRLALTPREHVVLSLVVSLLAAWAVVGSDARTGDGGAVPALR